MPILDWIGKKAVVGHHREVPFHLLRTNEDLSIGGPGRGNLLVQGDNLIALKALLPYYAGKVKCIYIDPPYNTGNENWTYYDGRYRFRKHYYPVVGELRNEGEEFECAKFIDTLSEVKFWVRNLPGPGRETSSLWLQTSTDKFYPDFVCQLTDDRQLIIEYKNSRDWSNEDSTEKRNLGEIWEEQSDSKCLFIMPKGIDDLESIRTKIR